ncbi:unnamed protein product [Soboliphyme baturini]|uniref:PKS_ER domain-containing protein n=1 Tax=Soboliphyme baturini TaxID=241478 RepID=A0A183IJG0_9BILA|nr:unnamed protein product [Soboliphyme baturini]
MVRNLHHLKPQLPFVPGFELAGEIAAVGKEVTQFHEGDRVMALKTIDLGAFAEKCVVDEDEAFKINPNLSYEMAAVLPCAYGSAYYALQTVAKVEQKQTILVLTSQGASGMAAIDLALNVFKCKVIAACDNEEKCTVIRPMGVTATVDYSKEELTKAVMKATKQHGVDLVVDTVGGRWFHEAANCVKEDGKVLVQGFSSGQVPTIDVQHLVQKQLSLQGVWFGGYIRRKPDKFHSIMRHIMKLLEDEYLSPVIRATYKIENVRYQG